MCSKKFAGKKKIKKIEKQKKKRKIPSVPIKSPPKTNNQKNKSKPLVLLTSAAFEKPVSEIENDPLISLNIVLYDNHFEHESFSNISDWDNQHLPLFKKPEPNFTNNDNQCDDGLCINEPDGQHSQYIDFNFPLSSDLMEDEGMEPIFHKQYQKVECLDSPKMSNSSSKKGNSLFKWKLYDDPFLPNEQFTNDNKPDMFTKMKNFCNVPTKLQSRFKLIPAINEEKPGEKILVLSNDVDLSLYSQTPEVFVKKSSSRRSRKNSRKNSSVENLTLV